MGDLDLLRLWFLVKPLEDFRLHLYVRMEHNKKDIIKSYVLVFALWKTIAST